LLLIYLDAGPTYHEPTRDNCEHFIRHCESLTCPYGVRKSYDGSCERCECEDPCAEFDCPIDSKCSVDYIDQRGTPVASCRKFKKPGQCPRLQQQTTRCDNTECHDDSDCRGEEKCCSAGCINQCVDPVHEEPSNTSHRPLPEENSPTLEDVPEENLKPVAREGGVATLRCFATGFPPPSITWKRGGIEVSLNFPFHFS